MEQIQVICRRYGRAAAFSALFAAAVCLLFGAAPLARGIVLGALFSIINFILMGRGLPVRVTGDRRRVVLKALSSLFFRYVFMAIPLYLGLTRESINVFAVAGGLFSIQMVILADHAVVGPLFAARKRRI
ncbi:MAG: ATP synthase subunit I [Proteobacteria bacterium]|nr:ATP synthase subunit I [Pseudomonadota bacterium]